MAPGIRISQQLSTMFNYLHFPEEVLKATEGDGHFRIVKKPDDIGRVDVQFDTAHQCLSIFWVPIPNADKTL